MTSLSFQARLTLFSALLGVVVLGCTLTATFVAVQGAVADRVRDELVVAGRLFGELTTVRQRQLLESALVLTEDFGFKEAVGIGEAETIRSALDNHGARIGADAAFLLDLDGNVVTGTSQLTHADTAFPQLFERAVQQGYAASTAVLDGKAFQLVLLPVRAPVRIAWVALGFRIDESTVGRLHSLTGAEVTFFDPASPSTVYASSRVELPELTEIAAAETDTVRRDAAGHFLSLVPALHGVSAKVAVALQLSLDEALAPFQSLYLRLAAIGGTAVLLALLGAAALAGNVTRPIRYLATAARRIAAGDYRQEIRVARNDELGQLGSAFNHMQTALAEREAEIRHQAHHDALTDLPNRALAGHKLVEALECSREAGTGVAVLMVGLNQFKAVNDVYGYGVGDDVLRHLANGLPQHLRSGDVLARIGPARFLVMADDLSQDEANTLAARLLEFIAMPLPLEVGTVELSASVGIAMAPGHGDAAETLMRRAEITLDDAKEAGDAVHVYEIGRDERHLRNLSLVADLRRATEEDELILYLQPKQSLRHPEHYHAEALLRWRHPEHGMLRPDEFIPLAEQAGQIGLVTQWVLDRTLRQMAAWQARGEKLHVSVNLSAVDLLDAELPMRVRDALTRHRVAAELLTLEITETAVVQDEAGALAALASLRDCGVRLSIDDFGVGHSSLAQLKRLPVDELKIDKAFVFPLGSSDEDEMIVRSIIELGHNLGLEVCAEGVETEAVRSLLDAQDCDTIQGYLLSPPLECDAFRDWYPRHYETA